MLTISERLVIKSYARHLAFVEIALALNGATDWHTFALAAAGCVVPPAIAAIDSEDPRFGRLAKQARNWFNARLRYDKAEL